ncbi:MAG: DUF2007 domain-containing protein [Crocinitomicaceae bacterium]
MENRTLVHTTSYEHVATMLRDKLEAAGINVLILDQHDSISEVIGGWEIHVNDEDAEEAKKIVDQVTR